MSRAGPTITDSAAAASADAALEATEPRATLAGGVVDLVGRTVDRYQVTARLGAGGMGVVFAAYDPGLDRKVALKVLPPLDDVHRHHLEVRLRREAQALARLQHPNVVAVHDVGVAEHSVFVAMQLVDGATLADHLAEARPPPRRILELFAAAGRGLAAAHDAAIVHRDFKPSNVLVDRAGRVCVGDFGLARTSEDDLPPAPAPSTSLLGAEMTRAGAVMGTPHYMAPEQHRGEAATARSDQFSFCVSAWEALFGTHPFAAGAWNHAEALAAMSADAVREPRRPSTSPAWPARRSASMWRRPPRPPRRPTTTRSATDRSRRSGTPAPVSPRRRAAWRTTSGAPRGRWRGTCACRAR